MCQVHHDSVIRGAGHSLGGAVAALCTLKLLGIEPAAAERVSCITFACVALGNPEVSHVVQDNGWSHLFHNFILPGVSSHGFKTVARVDSAMHQAMRLQR
jgi:Lipase (class 3)